MVAKYPKWDGTPHGRQENPIYAAMLESLDDAVGRVVDALDRAGLADKTLVLFTSDNGGLATREGAEHPADDQRPLARGEGLALRGRPPRPADRPLAGPDHARRRGHPGLGRRPARRPSPSSAGSPDARRRSTA